MSHFGSKPKLIRLFIALDIPDEWKDEVCRKQIEFPGGSWITPDKIHLTVRFLGNTSIGNSVLLKDYCSVGERFTGPIPLVSEGIGFFPNQHRVRSLHIRVKLNEPLQALKKELDQDLRQILGVIPEEYFVPHITVMRMHRPVSEPELEQLHEWGKTLELPDTRSTTLTLYHSYYESRMIHAPLARVVRE